MNACTAQTDPFYGTGRETLASGHVTDAARLNLSNVSDPLTTQGTAAPTSRMLGETPSSCAVKGVPVECVPLVAFITERQYRLRPEQAAHRATGRNRTTGELTLTIGIRQRQNGIVHFDADLWRLALDLHPDAIARLYRHWHDLNADYSLPKKTLRRMDCHFSRTTIIFDAAAGQVEDWRGFLTELLFDLASYVDIRPRKSP